jgi:DNA-binding CsgD family transcriptional regulator
MRQTEYGLTEREGELSFIERSLLAAQSGTGRIVLIEGPAGGGKTSVLSAAHRMADRLDMQVLSAGGSELERGFPFGVAIQLAEHWWTAVDDKERTALAAGPARLATQLLDGTLLQDPALQSDRSYPIIHGLFWLVSKLASRAATRSPPGLAILVDDLQDTDRPSLRFLAYLAVRIADLPIALLATVREGEVPHDPVALWTIQNAPEATVLHPPALSQSGVERLVRAEFPRASVAFVAACCQVTGGNPFLLTELLAQMRSDRHSPDDATADRLAELAPATIVNSVVARLGAMSPADRALATAIAVLGDRASLASAARFAELDLEVASRAADSLAAVQLLHRGIPLSFVHPVIRSAVLASMPPLANGHAHRKAASILREHGAPAEVVAAHLLSAPAHRDPEAVDALRDAARTTLSSGEPANAVSLLNRALDEQPSREVYPEVLAELGQAEARAGLPHAPQRLDDAIRVTDDPARRAELALEQGRALVKQRRYRDATTIFDRGLQELDDDHGPLSESLDCGFILAASAVPGLVDEALRRRGQMLDRLSGAPTRWQRAALAHSVIQDSLLLGSGSRIRELAELAWDDASLLDADPVDEESFAALTGALLFSDALERQLEICDSALVLMGDRDVPEWRATACHARAWALYERGQIAQAAADAKTALDVAGEAPNHVRTAYGALACCHLMMGQLGQAERALAMLDDDAVEQSVRQAFLLEVRAQLRLAQHRPREALEDAVRAGNALESSFGVKNPGVVAWRSTAALAHLSLGQPHSAEELAADELERARRAGVTRVETRDLRVLGLVAGGEIGLALLEEAAGLADQNQPRLESLHALVDFGAALRRAKKRSAGREILRKAFELSRRNGATALAERAATEFSVSGVRSSRRQLMTGVEALTPSERRVGELAAGGMTTRQIAETLFVTPKTVEFHLRHIYRKLEINSRDQLADTLSSAQTDQQSID